MTINNPWLELNDRKQKRINEYINHNIYWAKDDLGNYCVLFTIKDCFTNFKSFESKQLKAKSNKDNLVIMLKNTEGWEIFKLFCEDLVTTINKLNTNIDILNTLEVRIEEWKKLFVGQIKRQLSFEEQMGLFSELDFLEKIILKNNKTIECWRGPEKNLQDFLCFNCAIEIKSSITSEKKLATISSINQLETDKQNLYLIYYSLTQDKAGESVQDIIIRILQNLNEVDKVSFQKKILGYGYNFEENNYSKFIIDSMLCFDAKDEKFPKLKSKDIPKEIVSIKYKININECSNFKIEINSILEEI
ncbi:PD-(D/E)XK motif protein [Cetobacterium sp.]|uniref:PD-(D/E)XK motif protein n=1 Tax=Cetobacterium sp. TaxID=2071632 RepID=UPI003F3F8CB4